MKKKINMSLLKAFVFSLLALMISNLLLVVILYASFGRFDDIISLFTAGATTSLIYNIFCSMGRAIWLNIDNLAIWIVNGNLFYILISLIVLVVPLIAAIVAGRVGEKRIHSFFGIFLTSIVSMIVSLILMFNNISYQLIITSELSGNVALYVVVLGSLLNGLIFGLLAFITTKRK